MSGFKFEIDKESRLNSTFDLEIDILERSTFILIAKPTFDDGSFLGEFLFVGLDLHIFLFVKLISICCP